MKYNYRFFLCFFLFLLFNSFLHSQSDSYNTVFKQVKNLKPDLQKVATVKDIVLKRDASTFTFIYGKIYSTVPINNKIRALIFVGKGSCSFIPGNDIEKDQLNRFFGTRELNEDFNYLVMFFADSTFDELKNKMNFVPGVIPDRVDGYLRNGLGYILANDERYVNSSFMLPLLEDEKNDFFFSLFKSEKNGELLFSIDPFANEEISLLRGIESTKLFSDDMNYKEVICQFRKKDKQPANYHLSIIKDYLLDLEKYIIDVKIGEKGSFSAESEVFFKSNTVGGQWIKFNLYYDLVVDSIIWEDGKKIEFAKGEENNILWVKSPSQFKKNGKFSFKVYYGGDILLKIEEYSWLIIKDANYWYPKYGNREYSLFEITYHSPTKYLLASAGNKVSSTELDDVTTTKWITDKPIRNASFNVGFFEEATFDGMGFPKVNVFVSAGSHGTKTKNRAEDVAADIVNSLQFFTKIYGPIECKNLYATEINLPHGEAFPGLVHLGGSTFYETNSEGYDQVFRAHEVAHQWWGIGLDFSTYHDQWLSEGLSEYSGLFYMQTILNDNNKFFKLLERYKETIISGKNYLLKKEIEPGPIYLGYRNNTTDTEGDYNRIVYYKGAWVFHMLRLMMIDLKTMNESKYKNMIKDFFTSNYGKKVSTQDFQRVVEKHIGIDMSWFFNQWIFGNIIPEYQFAYKTEEGVDKKYHTVCKINATGLPDDFKTNLVLKIVFPNNQLARVRINMVGNHYEFKLPPLSLKPKELTLNDLNSVLCEVENVDWN